MKFDTLIIGGGLSGLICGIKLQKTGKRCAMVSSGQNALHFFSGGFGLLSRLPDGTPVDRPLEHIGDLDKSHPYSMIGQDRIPPLAEEARTILQDAGIQVSGDASANRYLISATGTLKPAWLTLDEMASVQDRSCKIGGKVLIINIEGFLDFSTAFIAEALEKRGTSCRIETISTDDTIRLRKNPSEMRASNIARAMESPQSLKKVTDKAAALINDEDCVLLPAVFGLRSQSVIDEIQKQLGIHTHFIGTMPPSVPGIRLQMQLKKAFENAGGTFLMGDEVTGGSITGDSVLSVTTANMDDEMLQADDYVLATGSYFGHGIMTDAVKVYEPVFGLDVQYNEDRETWYSSDFFERQAYLGFGVKTDGAFHAMKDGKAIRNLHVAGAVLGGCNPLSEGSGGGIAMLTALRVAYDILESK